MKNALNKVFRLEDRGGKIGIELLAGVITFIAMIYILPVNSSILGAMEMSEQGVFAATAIISGIITIFMGLYGNFPVVLSAGMGVNAYLAFTVYKAYNNWIAALIVMFLAGSVFLLLTLTALREKIINAIPNDIKYILSAALGGFIAFVGLKNAGIIASDGATFVTLGNLGEPRVLIAMIGILLVFALSAINNPKLKQLAIPISMGVILVLGIVVNYAIFYNGGSGSYATNGLPFYDTNASWGISGLGDVAFKIFTGGEIVTNAQSAAPTIETVSAGKAWLDVIATPATYAFIFSLVLVNLFDTTATMMAVGREAGIVDENGNLIDGRRALLADAVGAAVCAPLGTSTVTTFAESSVGTSIGARTGLSAVMAGVLFLLSAFIYPLFTPLTSSTITSLALVAVGASMFTNNLKHINWDDAIIGITAFVTFILTLLTYSISEGLGFGLIVYILMMLVSKRYKEINPFMYGIAGFYVVYFILDIFL